MSLGIGDRIRVRDNKRSPYSGRLGVIIGVDASDGKGAYLVRFEDGLNFRYNASEIDSTSDSTPHPHNSPSGPHRLGTRP